MRLFRRLRQEDGAQLVEFALVLPLLLFVVLGIAEFGIIFQRYEVVTNAAREGARLAVLPGYIGGGGGCISSRARLCAGGRVPITAGTPPASIVAVDIVERHDRRGWRLARGQYQAVHRDLHASLHISSVNGFLVWIYVHNGSLDRSL